MFVYREREREIERLFVDIESVCICRERDSGSVCRVRKCLFRENVYEYSDRDRECV